MRWFALLVLTGCAHEDQKHSFKLDIEHADGSSSSLSLSDRTGYFHRDSAYATMSWPSFDEYQMVPEFAYIDYAAMVPGPQALPGGEIFLANGTSYRLQGVIADMEVEWRGGKNFPVVQTGTFEAVVNGDTLFAEFSMGPSNCMNNITRSGGCGGPYLLEEPLDVTWVPQFEGCPATLVEAVLGADRAGVIGEDETTLGDVSLECEMNYNLEVMCGDKPFEIEVDGCTWEVFNYARSENVAIYGADGTFVMNAGNTCEGEQVATACNSTFAGFR